MAEALQHAAASDAVDCSAQISRAKGIAASFGDPRATSRLAGRPRCLQPRGEAGAQVVVGAAVVAELGHPGAPSCAVVLTTARGELVEDGLVRCYGPDLDGCPPEARAPLALVALVAHDRREAPDPFALAARAGMANRVPGLMTRLSSGRLWLRASSEALAAGLSATELGRALAWVLRSEVEGVRAVEVLLVSGPEERVLAFEGVAAEARVLAGRHGKLVLGPDGIADCADLDCDRCEHKATCDVLRDVAIRYRASRGVSDGGRHER